ncbi:hypothetical protein [Hymenobacter chitinivorans]|uniref:Uncharacterized protein n=1 Tax=Hymenobacter chitinivorans DSM 11115 TaxID=1121954 RepID=A0A2M9BTI2_9BACT|nr:hypothetical protein [Hymenobacter chitinivorans]PJJ61268.1 hypothetical protein CLV45_2706 [Hymenobacter chitinivorans DSM 11115]
MRLASDSQTTTFYSALFYATLLGLAFLSVYSIPLIEFLAD